MKHINDKNYKLDVNDKNNQSNVNDKNKQQIPINDCWYKICCPEFNQCSQKKAGKNILVTGYYKSTSRVELGNGQWLEPIPDKSEGSAYIIKYNSLGIVQWAKSIDATNLSFGIRIFTDSANNVLVTGYYNSTTPVQLGNGQWLNPTTNDGYKTYAFIIKYNSSGIVQWAKSINANLGSFGFGISTDSANNVLVTGAYSSTTPVQLGNGQSLKPTPNDTYNNPFIIKYNTQGVVQWAKSVNQVNDQRFTDIDTGGFGITTDSANNVLVTGGYISKNRVELGNGQWLKPSSKNGGNTSAFIIKYNSIGNALWAKSIDADGISKGDSITIDSANNVLVTGGYISTIPVQLGNGQLLKPTPKDIDYIFAFIIKYNSLGNALWAKTIDANVGSIGSGITTDSANNVLVTGDYGSTTPVQLGNGQLLDPTPVDGNERYALIIKYNTQGTVQWARSVNANSEGSGITIDFANNILVTGKYSSTTPVQLGNGQLLNPTPEEGSALIIKYNTQGIVQSATSIPTVSTGTGISS